jgi:ribosomal protein L4
VRTSPDRMAGGRRSGGRAMYRQKGARARDLGDGVWGREGRVTLCRIRPRRPSGR